MRLVRAIVALSLLSVSLTFGASAAHTSRPCPGCKGHLRLGTATSAPGYRCKVGLGNAQGTGAPTPPDGACHVQYGLCVEQRPCQFYERFTFGVPSSVTMPLVFCTWNTVTQQWDCIIVNGNFSSGSNGTHDENAGRMSCGHPALRRKVVLGGASQEYELRCDECG